QALGVAPEACAMVGDTVVDVRAARRAGAWSVAVLCGFGEEPELRRAGAHWILPGTADLLTQLHMHLEP
ncbi:MAG: HAD family hydrolase, partial [Anaerolineae bacterium]|nr:HAD family hydrolase [Anaerolineae bacterium]